MAHPNSTQHLVTIAELVTRLEELSHGEPCNLAFDGDGTLWSGDVSDDVFLSACQSNWLLESVRPLLLSVLNERNLATEGAVGDLLVRLFEAEKQGKLNELLLYEIMTWCYAGRSVTEVAEFANRTLLRLGIESRLRWEYRPLLDWARSHGHACWLVSASPWPIVRVVARRLGFEDHDMIAARPIESASGIIGTTMATPVPYCEQKVIQLNQRRKGTRLLAAFGDSPFDLEMLAEAELAVAVSPKPALANQLNSLEQVVVLML